MNHDLIIELVDQNSDSLITDILNELKEYNPLISISINVPNNVNIDYLKDDLYLKLNNFDVQ